MRTNLSIKPATLIAVLAVLLGPIRSVNAVSASPLPAFSDFVASVRNGQVDVITGVYVSGLFAFPVVAQPAANPGYVSTKDAVVTRFGMAEKDHVIGLLAHNNLAGATFSNLSVGQDIYIVYGDGHFTTYRVNQISQFQALQPTDMNSQFLDLGTDRLYSAGEIFNMFYVGNDHVTFQTCIARDGESSWGRLFVTAVPNPFARFISPDMMDLLVRAWPNFLEVSR